MRPTRRLFQHWKPSPPERAPQQTIPDLLSLSKAADLAQAIRSRGYLDASLDPLGSHPPGDPSLTLEYHNLERRRFRPTPSRNHSASQPKMPGRRYKACARSTANPLATTTGTSASPPNDPGSTRAPKAGVSARHRADRRTALLERLTPGGGLRAFPAAPVSRQDALLDRRPGYAHPHAG